MRWNRFLITIWMAAAVASAAMPSVAATFGTVVPIGGHASDIALDESRGVLYVANFTANRIEVMSTADYSIHSSMNVAAQPGALSLSPDNQFLLVAHFGNFSAPDTSKNAVTLINLNDDTRQTFTTGDVPLGVAFVADGRALIITTAGVLLFDPITGAMNVVAMFEALAKTLPADPATFPSQVILAALSTNPDRTVVYGVADDGNFQAFLRFDTRTGRLYAIGVVAVPKPLPRIGVSADGSWALVGQYKLDPTAVDLAQFPNSIESANIGGSAVDSKAGVIYAQILTADPASTSAGSSSSSSTPAAPTGPPVLSILDADNLYVREKLQIPENLVGRATLNEAAGRALCRQRQRCPGHAGRQTRAVSPRGGGAERHRGRREFLRPQRHHADPDHHRSGRRQHRLRHRLQRHRRHHLAGFRPHPGHRAGARGSLRVSEPERHRHRAPHHYLFFRRQCPLAGARADQQPQSGSARDHREYPGQHYRHPGRPGSQPLLCCAAGPQ